ncbi:MAG: hypothetical protein IT260_22545 [Saprospiraceae bacterium]|nr:hypothetical protein [Saprospiraceae bacterium]
MKTFLKVTIAFLLLFNGSGALFGGWNLMAHPDGSSIQLSMDWLRHTPFPDYFIPGLVLFICNGLFSIVALLALLFAYRHTPWLVIAQGAILSGWIIIQMLFMQTVHFWHLALGFVGLALLLLGWRLRKYWGAG